MAETEQREGQKTVVAFIAGLLIGGLLVWVFSSSPEGTLVSDEAGNDDTETVTDIPDTGDSSPSDDNDGDTAGDTAGENETDTQDPNTGAVGNGSLSVSDQSAGSVVVIENVTYPTSDGWIAVRDYENGTPGNVLGAARYSESEGLRPREVNLLRATEAGMTYQVVFFNENGDRVFDLADDQLLSVGATTFSAQ